MRQDSVYNGIIECISEVALIHDAARPSLQKGIILNVYRKLLSIVQQLQQLRQLTQLKN